MTQNNQSSRIGSWIGKSPAQRPLGASANFSGPERKNGSIWRSAITSRPMVFLGKLILLIGILFLLKGFWLLRESFAAGEPVTGLASWYSLETCRFNRHPACPTASGKSLYTLERDGVRFAASFRFPLGTKLRITNLDNGKSTEAAVLDRGPHPRLKREIDLGKKAFAEIADPKKGLIRVSVEVLHG